VGSILCAGGVVWAKKRWVLLDGQAEDTVAGRTLIRGFVGCKTPWWSGCKFQEYMKTPKGRKVMVSGRNKNESSYRKKKQGTLGGG